MESKGSNLGALILPVLIVILGHLLGQMITDNFYFDGIKPVRKKRIAPHISDTRVLTV